MGRGVHSLKLTNAGVPIAIVTYFNSFRFFQKVHNIGIKSGHGENAGHIRASFKISRMSDNAQACISSFICTQQFNSKH